MKKKILRKALAGVMLVSIFTFIPVTKVDAFTDVATDHWANSCIETMEELGIINGYGDGTFKPEQEVKLCEFLKMATVSIWNVNTNVDLPEGAHWVTPYAKVANHFLIASDCYEYADWEKYITRQKAVEIIWKMYSLKHLDVRVNKQGEELKAYSDEALITDEKARRYFEFCIQLGLVDGFEDGTLRPQATLTRAQAAKLLLYAQ